MLVRPSSAALGFLDGTDKPCRYIGSWLDVLKNDKHGEFLRGGTNSSNPSPSREESAANLLLPRSIIPLEP
jgi:hypothetical protein